MVADQDKRTPKPLKVGVHMFSSVTNPALEPVYVLFALANALGALYALYANVRESGFKPLCQMRNTIAAFAMVNLTWFVVLIFTPIGTTPWLNVYFGINLVSWHYVWSRPALNSDRVKKEYSKQIEEEIINRMGLETDKDD